MTNPSPPPALDAEPPIHDQQPPRPSLSDMLDLGRLRRDVAGGRVAGVASGLARHLDIDPIIVRVTLVVLIFFGGAGLLVYAVGWLLVPKEGSSDHPLGLDDRNRNLALLGTGILATLAVLSDTAGAFSFPWALVVVGLLAAWFLNRKDREQLLYYPPASGADAHAAGTGPAPATVHTAYQQPNYSQPIYARPRNPRKRGPILFWFTLALIATGIGTLGIIDVSGTSVPDPAYPALGLALTGTMLVLGAFWGRAGGLIFLGLVLGTATLAATATNSYDNSIDTYTPPTSADVRDSYVIDGGELVVDLSEVRDVEGLDGRDVTVKADVGEVTVIVPSGMDVTVAATADIGEVHLFGGVEDGFDISDESSLDGGDDVPAMKITIDLGVGQVTVREQ